MKKIITTSVIAATAILFASCGPTQKDAIAYNDNLIKIEKELTPMYNMYIDQIDGHNADSLRLTYKQASEKADAVVEECKKIEAFAEKREYLDAAIGYFSAISNSLKNEGKQITEIMTKDSTQLSEEDIDNATALAEKIDADTDKALQKVQEAQTAFAKEWKFEIKQ